VSCPLVLLLDKCHREELGPLCALHNLDVNAPIGRHDLVRIVAGRVRKAGGQALANLARGGEGPPYKEVVRDVALSLDLPGTGEVETMELSVVHSWLATAWDSLSDTEQERIWAELQHHPSMQPVEEAPPHGLLLVEKAAEMFPREFTFKTTALAAFSLSGIGLIGILARPFMPFMAVASLLGSMAPSLRKTLPSVVWISMLRQQVRYRVTIGFVGSPSCGKDAAIKALIGLDSGNINPVAGSTSSVTVSQVSGSTALFVVNTPGMGDVVESVTEEALQVLSHIDVYIYVLNCEGGVQARELADYQACLDSEKPVLVALNKIDVLRPRDRARYIEDAREKLGGEQVQLIPCAFDPLPQLSELPINTAAVHSWLAKTLEALGKDPAELPEAPPSAPLALDP